VKMIVLEEFTLKEIQGGPGNYTIKYTTWIKQL